MRLCSWPSRAATYPWRSFAYLYSAFSERSPCARATLISLGSSSWSSCSSAAISAFSFFFIFSARSIILGIVGGFYIHTEPSNCVFDVYLKIIEDLRGVSQMGLLAHLAQTNRCPSLSLLLRSQAAEASRWWRMARITISSTSAGWSGYLITSNAPRRVASRYSFHSPVCVVTTKRGCLGAVRERESNSR